MCTTDYIVKEINDDIMRSTKAQNESCTDCAEALWNEALRSDRAYDDNVLKDILTKGLSELIHRSMHSYFYLRLRKNGAVHNLTKHTTSLNMLPRGWQFKCTCHNEKKDIPIWKYGGQWR